MKVIPLSAICQKGSECALPPLPTPPIPRWVMTVSGCFLLLVSHDCRSEFLLFSYCSVLFSLCDAHHSSLWELQPPCKTHSADISRSSCLLSIHLIINLLRGHHWTFTFVNCLLEHFPVFVVCDPTRHFSPAQESLISTPTVPTQTLHLALSEQKSMTSWWKSQLCNEGRCTSLISCLVCEALEVMTPLSFLVALPRSAPMNLELPSLLRGPLCFSLWSAKSLIHLALVSF